MIEEMEWAAGNHYRESILYHERGSACAISVEDTGQSNGSRASTGGLSAGGQFFKACTMYKNDVGDPYLQDVGDHVMPNHLSYSAARPNKATDQALRDTFHLSLSEAAKKFGMCTTAFKKLCRKQVPSSQKAG